MVRSPSSIHDSQTHVDRLDIIGATTTSRMPYWTSKDIKATLERLNIPSERPLESEVFHCPIDLLGYIAEIMVHYKLQPNVLNIDQDGMQKAIQLGTSVNNWDAPKYEADSRSHIVEVWRLGILLYLTRLFQIDDNQFNPRGLISRIFHHARAIPARTSWNVSTTWPLFQTGLFLTHEDKVFKVWLRNELLTNFQTLGCFNLNRAATVLEEVWQMGDDELNNFFAVELLQQKLVL